MTSLSRIDRILVAVSAGVVLFGGGLAWPGLRETWACDRRLEDLHLKMADRPDRTDEVRRLAELIEAIDLKMSKEFRVVPEMPNIAGVVRALSVPVDGRTVQDQTFSAHAPVDAVPESGLTARAMPLTVEMRAQFDAVFSLLRTTESMGRLVRVDSLSLKRTAGDTDAPSAPLPVLNATIGLEAIYEPGAGSEEE